MTAKMVRQTTFSLGQVDPVNFRRTDLSLYMEAAQSMENMIISSTAYAQKRYGSLQINNLTSYCTPTSRAFPFIDKNGNYYLVLAQVGQFDIFDYKGNHITSITFAPMTSNVLATMGYTNVNDSIVFVQGTVQQWRIFISDYTTNPVTFQLNSLTIYPYPSYDFGTINYNNFTVNLSVSGSTLTFQFTGLSSDPGFNSEWIGGQIIGAGPTADTPLGYAIITNVSYSSGTTTFTADVQLAFLTSGFATTGNQYSIRQPAFSSTLGWPSVVGYYQNRLFFAATSTLPLGLFGSQTNQVTNFDVGIGNPTDALVYTLGDSSAGPIVAINAGKQLEIYTQNYEYVCPQDQDIALTPQTFAIRQQSSEGSQGICKPVTYNNDSYYIAKTGKSIIRFQFDGIGLAYISTNVSVQSQSLVKNPTNRVVIRGDEASQDNFVYYLNPDNTITAFQFADEFKLAALTPITFQDDIELIDIVGINNQLYIIKFYALTNQYMLEAMTDQDDDGNTIRLDSAVVESVPSNGVITGLDDLNGYTVDVFLNGQDYGTYTVSGGQITVNNQGATGNAYVGLIYPVEFIPMYTYVGPDGADYYKYITRIFVDYNASLDFYVNGQLVIYQNFADIQAGISISPQSGTANIWPALGYNQSSTFTITQNSPFDLQITGIGYMTKGTII